MKGSYGVSETEATNLGIQWFYTGPLFMLLLCVFCGILNSRSRCVSDSFACFWTLFLQFGCLGHPRHEGFCIVLMYFVLTCLVCPFWREKDREWIWKREEVGKLGRVEVGKTVWHVSYERRMYFQQERKHSAVINFLNRQSWYYVNSICLAYGNPVSYYLNKKKTLNRNYILRQWNKLILPVYILLNYEIVRVPR